MLSVVAFFLHTICFLGAIGEIAAFPKAFTKEEEAYWIRRLEAGDETAREQLIVHNLRLVAHIAKKYEKNPSDRDDLISCGTIGLIKAVSSFSEEKGTLSGYASRCIENEILMAFRRERKLVQTVSMEDAIGQDKEGNELSLMELVCSEEDSILDQVQHHLEMEQVYRAMRQLLSHREQTVLSLRFGLNGGVPMAQREVANILGISRSYVSRIESKALEKIRKEFHPEKRDCT